MKNLSKFNIALVLMWVLLLFACEDDDGTPMVPVTPPIGTEGFFIVNEGGWGNGNTSLSFYNRETETITNDLFYDANGQIALGDQAQSMAIHDTLGYVVVQNSAKIEVIDIDDYASVATITEDIESPRYFVGYSDTKGFVTDWGVDGLSGTVKVIDMPSFEVSNTIQTGQGSNNMLLVGNRLFVTNSGGWGRDTQVNIIDADSEQIIESIEIGDNPNSIQADANGDIWVLTSGHTEFDENWNVDLENSTNGSLYKLSASGDILNSLEFPELGSPTHLNISADGETLYYLYNGAVFSMDHVATELPTAALIEKSYYGLSIDPIDGSIIGCEAPDFSSSGNIDIYSSAGALLSTHQVGIAPNSCTFK